MPVYRDLITGKEGTTEFFFLNLLFKARLDTGNETSKDFVPELEGIVENDRKSEEDVNVYIADALNSVMDPAAIELRKRLSVPLSQDVGVGISKSTPRSAKYLFYKVNADGLLLCLGLFKPEDIPFEAYLDTGTTYYAAAAGYRQEIDRGRSPIVLTLEKMAIGFNRYVGLLRFMKHKYPELFSFGTALSSEQVREIERNMNTGYQVNKAILH